MTRRQRAALVAGLVVILAACGRDDGASPPTTATPSTTSTASTATTSPFPSSTAPATTGSTTSTTAAPGQEVVFDWAGRPDLELAGGWTVSACEGDAPLACVALDSEPAGVVEQLGFPLDSLPDLRDALDEGLPPVDVLELFAVDEIESLEADRQAGCDPEYDARPVGPEEAPVAGQPGLRYAFQGLDGSGAVVERISKHALLTEEGLFLVVASALEPESCLAPEGEFRVALLEQFEPELARLAAGSRFGPLGWPLPRHGPARASVP